LFCALGLGESPSFWDAPTMLKALLALNELDAQVFDSPEPGAAPRVYDSHVVVPDAHLLFNGEFKRVGTGDLKIVGDDGQSFFIPDYFAAEKRANLMSPEGATLSAAVVEALAGPLAPGQLAQAGGQAASAQPIIGRVDALTGSATVVRNGVSVALNIGDTVRKGDVVQTSGGSAVAIVFSDGTTFSLNANARMVLNEFVYGAGGAGNAAAISLVQGAFSFVAGQVAKTGEMRVETPVATMGIRGTAVLVEISASDGQTKFSVMVEPDGTTGAFNLYNKTTGALIATVNNSAIGWVVSPAGPLQVVAQQQQKTPAELAQELGIVQQIFTIFNNNQQNPFIPTQDRGDNQNDNNPQTAGSSGSGTSTDITNGSPTSLSDLITNASNNPTSPPTTILVPLENDPLAPPAPTPPIITVTVTPNQPPIAADDPDGTPAGGDVIENDSDPEGSIVVVATVRPLPEGDAVEITSEDTEVAGQYGTLIISPDGTYTFEPYSEGGYDQLAEGEIAEQFEYTIRDPFGATSSAILTIKGVNDAPVIVQANASGSVGAGVGAPISEVAAGYLVADNDLITDLGGTSGFGELFLARNDDDSTGAINITSVFGEQGLNFFGTNYTSFFINNNGNITFLNATGQFTPSQIAGGSNNPIIAPFWADVDTRGGTTTATPGGNSTGSNLVYYGLDAENGVVTITWDDVGYYSHGIDKLNAFQLQLIDRGNGDFDIVFRYEDINWTTGSASGGSGGLGGTPARAGYTAGDGNPAHYFELVGSGDQSSMLALESAGGNTGIGGVYVFEVRAGEVGNPTSTGTIEFSDADVGDTHTVLASFNAEASSSGTALGALNVTLTRDTATGLNGLVTWNYVADSDAVSDLPPGTVRTEVYDVVISDGNGGTVTQQVTITVNGPKAVAVTILSDNGYNIEEFYDTLFNADVTAVSESHISLHYRGETSSDDRYFEVTTANLTYSSQINQWEEQDYRLTGGTITDIYVSVPGDENSVPVASFEGFNISATQLQAAIDYYDDNEGDESQLDAIFGAYSYHATGGDGPDVLTAGDADDVIDGGAGDDAIDGQGGNDILSGGEGADIFKFDAGFGNDVILDFVSGEDSIHIGPTLSALVEDYDFEDFAIDGEIVRIDGADVVIVVGNDSLRIANVYDGNQLHLSANDFVLQQGNIGV
jgi:VCBS repeat-containing protein